MSIISFQSSNKKGTTLRQKRAVHFCEELLHISFEGNLEDRSQVSDFLSEYLDDAKNLYEEIRCEYEAYLWSLD